MVAESLLPDVLARVAENSRQPDEELARLLRGSFEGVHFSVCRDDDMPPRVPFVVENAFCRLYYVKSGDHCVSLTTDSAAATGLVVALVDQDE